MSFSCEDISLFYFYFYFIDSFPVLKIVTPDPYSVSVFRIIKNFNFSLLVINIILQNRKNQAFCNFNYAVFQVLAIE